MRLLFCLQWNQEYRPVFHRSNTINRFDYSNWANWNGNRALFFAAAAAAVHLKHGAFKQSQFLLFAYLLFIFRDDNAESERTIQIKCCSYLSIWLLLVTNESFVYKTGARSTGHGISGDGYHLLFVCLGWKWTRLLQWCGVVWRWSEIVIIHLIFLMYEH